MKRFWTVLAIVVLVAFACSAAFGTIGWMKVFKSTYKVKSDTELGKAKCAACHVQKNGKGGLNVYGKMLNGKKEDKESLKAVEKKDADKDGITNIDEIKAGTNPGDKKSKPEKK